MGNAIQKPAVLSDTRDSFVLSEDPILTTVIGLEDVIVISTSDAVLVTQRGKAEEVKELVEQLKRQNHRAAIEHRRIYRPWGYYQDVDIAAHYRVKRIMVKPGRKLRMQKHFHRSEHWIVVHGTAEVSVHDDVRTIHENESVYIPIGSVHRLSNPGKILSGGQLVKMISCGSMMVAAGCNCFAGRSNSSPSYYTRCASAFTGLSAAIAIVTRDLFLSVPPRAS